MIYTPLTHQEISLFAQLYSIGKISAFKPLRGGSTNSSYVIQAVSGEYILTISDDKSFEQTKNLVDLLIHLEKHNFPTSKIIKDKNNKYINDYQGKPLFLKQYLNGKMVEKANNEFMFQIGKMIALLHAIPVPKGVPNKFPYGLEYFSEILSDKKLNNTYTAWLEHMRSFLIKNISDKLPKGLVHGDIYLDNIIEENNKLVALIDFEEVSYSPFVFDIGMGIIGSCVQNNEVSLPKVKFLIKGYQKERTLSKLEIDSIRVFAIYGAVATSFWRYRQFNILFPEKNNSKKYLEMVKLADSLFEMDKVDFLKQLIV